MTKAETDFKNCVANCIADGLYPSPRQINIKLIQLKCIENHWACYCKVEWGIGGSYLPISVNVYPVRYFNSEGELHKSYRRSFDNLSGKQCRWRREMCAQLSYKLKGFNLNDKNRVCNDTRCKGYKAPKDE
jgi:hypothetical protein